jgi:hypothetical protein
VTAFTYQNWYMCATAVALRGDEKRKILGLLGCSRQDDVLESQVSRSFEGIAPRRRSSRTMNSRAVAVFQAKAESKIPRMRAP